MEQSNSEPRSTAIDGADLRRRALAAWFKSGGTDQPTEPDVVHTSDGKAYVVLYNTNGILAVYRVRNDGMLKGLKRYPKEISELTYA